MTRYIYLSIIILILCCSCSPRVIEFLNDGMDFSDYRTYRLIGFKADNRPVSKDKQIYFDSLEFFIHKNLMGRSYDKAGADSDLVVRYELVNAWIATSSNQNSYDPFSFYTPSRDVSLNKEGVLLIEFLDRLRGKLVWQASLNIRYPENKDRVGILKEAVDKVFSTYPYSAGSSELVTTSG